MILFAYFHNEVNVIMRLSLLPIFVLIALIGALGKTPGEASDEPFATPNMIGFKHLEVYKSDEVFPPFRSAGVKISNPVLAEGAGALHEQVYYDHKKRIVSRLGIYIFGDNKTQCEVFDEKVWRAVSSTKSLTFSIIDDHVLKGPFDSFLKRNVDCMRGYVAYLLSTEPVEDAHEDWLTRPLKIAKTSNH